MKSEFTHLRLTRQQKKFMDLGLASKKSNPDEILEAAKKIGKQESELGKEVAGVIFEEKCLEQFKLMCAMLRGAGYERLWIMDNSQRQRVETEIRASPKVYGGALYQIVRRFFPHTTSCGGTFDSDMQCISVLFPTSLIGHHDLTKEQDED